MSQYGIRIKNYEAGAQYEVNTGVRKVHDFTPAMLTNSLFSYFLMENGQEVFGKDTTRDVICIEFNYGSRSFDEELNHLNKQVQVAQAEAQSEDELQARLRRLVDLLVTTVKNKDLYDKKSKQELRQQYYTQGVDITYRTYNNRGRETNTETIHYLMQFRTPGKAKRGSCMFIREEQYPKAREFLYMGIKLPREKAPIVEMGAYSSLITSSIVGTQTIDPDQILVIKDVESTFRTTAISIETDENRQCTAVMKHGYEVKNTLFDGEALIDTSIFPKWADGYVLQRHHQCKMAAFHTDIQKFMRDHFGDEYETATLTDMFGISHFVKDIKLITTDNAMKWIKFDVGYGYWSDWVRKNGCQFGIVKTAHQSKLGRVQRMSYQMVNALNLEMMPQVVSRSLEFTEQLKTDDEVFLNYLRDNANFSNDYTPLVALAEQNPQFMHSDYFRERRVQIIRNYVQKFKNGHIIQNGDNLVIVGSPYALLLHSVGEDPEKDDTLRPERGTIQCFTNRFPHDTYLAAFRSPFNADNNLCYQHNVYSENMSKYFNFGEQIQAVNTIHTDLEDRANGCDFDADTFYTTDQEDIVKWARYCYLEYPTIVNNIPKEKSIYDNTLENYAAIDNNLASAQQAIGESSNLAQIALTYSYNFNDPKYLEYVCILSVLAQAAIDNCKRRYDIDIPKEISRIKSDMNIKANGYPIFWSIVRPGFDRGKINPKLRCPMNYIAGIKPQYIRSDTPTIPISEFFTPFHGMSGSRRKSRQMEELIEKYSLKLLNYHAQKSVDGDNEKYFVLRADFDEQVEDIKRTYISSNYAGFMSWILNRAFKMTGGVQGQDKNMLSRVNKNRSLLMKVLYDVNPKVFLSCFAGNQQNAGDQK